MKIISASDYHGNLPIIDKACDVFICGGDKFPNSTRMWSYDGRFQLEWAKENYFPWIKEIKADRIYSIHGNHDGILTSGDEIAQEYKMLCAQHNIILLEENDDVYRGVKFYGSSLSFDPNFPRTSWAFGRRTEKELADEYAKIPQDVDVLITHTPPYGIFDCGYMKHNGTIDHMGSSALRKRIMEIYPHVHIMNHIHEWGGYQIKLGQTLFVNTACSIVEINI